MPLYTFLPHTHPIVTVLCTAAWPLVERDNAPELEAEFDNLYLLLRLARDAALLPVGRFNDFGCLVLLIPGLAEDRADAVRLGCARFCTEIRLPACAARSQTSFDAVLHATDKWYSEQSL